MVRTRFAPSPTGNLHIGGLRTALYNYLYAKKFNGDFILRIEDTDLDRSSEAYTESILEALRWCNLNWDEIYFQSKRASIYQDYINKMLKNGSAYKCYCTKERLDNLKKSQMEKGENPHYDGLCKNINKDLGEPFVIRINLPKKDVNFEDKVHGELKFSYKEFDDFILQRSDGSFMYNLTNVVDDIEMQITHVIRGDDHITNTAKQLFIYHCLEITPPQFAHIPMILGRDKTRLSKRHGAASVLEYKNMGFLSQALLNYLARLGWSYGDKEIFSSKELIDYFDLDGLNKSPAVFDDKKLLWLNGYYIRNTADGMLYDFISKSLPEECLKFDRYFIEKTIKIMKPRVDTILDLLSSIEFFCKRPQDFDEKGLKKYVNNNTKDILQSFIKEIKTLDLKEEGFKNLIEKLSGDYQEKLINIAQPIRLALTGKSAGPGLYEIINLIGIKETVERVNNFLSII